METMVLMNGKKVKWDYCLTRDGMVVTVKARLTSDERREFKRELSSERDVVRFSFQ